MVLQDDLSGIDEFESLQGEIMSFSSQGIRPGLRRITRLQALLGDPQKRLRVIQVLGTNGKGSTAAMMEAMLGAGLRTALFTSPHLISLQERLRVAGKYVPIEDWRAAWNAITDTVTRDAELGADRPSFFEHFTALCLVLAEKARADAAILEAGMGGRYDATSVCEPAAVVVTPIGMDHTQYLGSTLEEIAGEKFAAAKRNSDAFYAGDDENLSRIFIEHCEKTGATPYILDKMARPEDVKCGLGGTEFTYVANGAIGGAREIRDTAIPLLGSHQAWNAARAITALLSMRDKFDDFAFLTPDAIKASIAQTDWPGRMELFRSRGGALVMLDGAHNSHAARTLVSSLASMRGEVKIGALALAMMSDKDIPPTLEILRELQCPVYCAGLPMERATRAEDLAEMARTAGMETVGHYGDPMDALEAAGKRAGRGEIILCCGSLYLVGYIRKILKY
jgi:dihydrofolate synthase/folylpolyglutamate synthase